MTELERELYDQLAAEKARADKSEAACAEMRRVLERMWDRNDLGFISDPESGSGTSWCKECDASLPLGGHAADCITGQIKRALSCDVGKNTSECRMVKAPATCPKCKLQFVNPTTGLVDSKCYKCGGDVETDVGTGRLSPEAAAKVREIVQWELDIITDSGRELVEERSVAKLKEALALLDGKQ